jgi:hypothetical protein
MKSILEKQKAKKNSKRAPIIIGTILVGLMIFSIIGYSFSMNKDNAQTSNKISYGKFDFYEKDGYWFFTNSDGNTIWTKYNPTQMERIQGFVSSINSYKNLPLYVQSFDITASIEVKQNLQNYAQRIQDACIENTKCEQEFLPIKTCQDNFIIIQESDEEGITQENGCIFIKGKKENIVKIVDEFLFETFSVSN